MSEYINAVLPCVSFGTASWLVPIRLVISLTSHISTSKQQEGCLQQFFSFHLQ